MSYVPYKLYNIGNNTVDLMRFTEVLKYYLAQKAEKLFPHTGRRYHSYLFIIKQVLKLIFTSQVRMSFIDRVLNLELN